MADIFNDIQIIGMDEEFTKKPEQPEEPCNVYFKLSEEPSEKWEKIFDAERELSRQSVRRNTWVEGQHIVVCCPLNEVKRYHFREIRRDVEATNRKYREFLHQ